jgi:hypothetical protein
MILQPDHEEVPMKKIIVSLITFAAFLSLSSQPAQALPDFPPPVDNGIVYAIQYGDFYSYSLPVLNYFLGTGGYNSSSEWYVGAPQPQDNAILIYTNANNVDDNAPGMDDAYESVTGNQPQNSFFNTSTTADPPPPFVANPDPVDPAFAGDHPDYWDAQIGALLNYLDGDSMYFFFNNNQLNSTEVGFSQQNLFAWGQVQIVDLEGGLPTLYFDFNNTFTGGDVTAYTSDGSGPDPYVNPLLPGDFVLSGGYVCFDAADQLQACDGTEVVRFAHNLGFNAAAYALYSPEIDMGLAGWFAGGYDIFRIDIRLRELNNGAEQLFILSSGETTTVIPEPSTLILLVCGLVGLGFIGRRRVQK